MKKLLVIVLSLVMVLSMAACSMNETPAEAPTKAPAEIFAEVSAEEPAEEPTEEPAKELTEKPIKEATKEPAKELTENAYIVKNLEKKTDTFIFIPGIIINFFFNNCFIAYSLTYLLLNGLIENLTPATSLKLVSTGPGHKHETTTLDFSLLNSSYIDVVNLKTYALVL